MTPEERARWRGGIEQRAFTKDALVELVDEVADVLHIARDAVVHLWVEDARTLIVVVQDGALHGRRVYFPRELLLARLPKTVGWCAVLASLAELDVIESTFRLGGQDALAELWPTIK